MTLKGKPVRKKQVRTFLEAHNLKAYHLADLSRMSRASLYEWLRGNQDITLSTWERIETAMRRFERKNAA